MLWLCAGSLFLSEPSAFTFTSSVLPCAGPAAVGAYHTLHAMQQLPAIFPRLPIIPIEPFQLTSFALSLLLVFRTNSSYGRWNEGRRRFGRITTTCRDICRQVGTVAGVEGLWAQLLTL